MGIFDLFKKKKQENKVRNFFDFPRNEEGFQQIVEWLKLSTEIILDVDHEGQLSVKIMPDGKVFLSAFTEVGQRVPVYTKNDKFIVLDFAGVSKLFEDNAELDFLWLNPNSDSAQINRSVFTPRHAIKKNTEIQIGLPAEPPVVLIDFLVNYAKENPTINHMYLGLARYNDEFSYLVFLDSEQTERIVPEIGPEISALCIDEKIVYPVDFVYDNFLADEQYLIYKK
ncbi:enhanced serine sensitivity protein SseB C-terminal domain-containing protein [Enterococcus sp. 5H]|uniref:enhanced serine sensitivity protein SseB C-terminal domain-containing protein n=1 Tax=Enterococcus sp. 5H TaxID=1229490 RepID=UPI002304B4BA|nr:enhanced serine sensitivity protein SseB C-terminal domain-containing protein [Enterococcus sp. 5H]MDA9472244.1 hypothetical protein [Enterococcus sp. 5H]